MSPTIYFMNNLIPDSDTVKQIVIDYINASNDVYRFAASVLAANLPALVSPPPHYSDYSNALAQAKIDSSVWTTSIVDSFSIIPETFVNFNDTIQGQLTAVLNGLNTLKSDPGNAPAIGDIKNAIGALMPEMSTAQRALSGLESKIGSYQNTINPDATSLNSLAQEIAAAENADQTAIAQMQEAFDNLQTLVDSRNTVVSLNTASNLTGAIFFGVVGAAVCAPFGGVPALIVGVSVGTFATVFTTFVPIHSNPEFEQSLKDIQVEMNGISSEIGIMNSTIGLLQQISDSFMTLVVNSANARQKIKIISDFWQNFENDVNNLYTDIGDILAHNEDPTYIDTAIAQMQDAQNSWNDVQTFMQQIQNITYTTTQVNTNPQRN